MKKKKVPEIIEVSVDSLEGLKSRLTSGTLLEEDKPVLLAIVSAYVWIQRQLKATKLTIHNLKKMFGFSTEKRKQSNGNGKGTDLVLDLATHGILSNEQESLNELETNRQEPPVKK